jgi:hypothetical protein
VALTRQQAESLRYFGQVRAERALSEEELEEEWEQVDGAKRSVEDRMRRSVRDTFLDQAARIEDRIQQGSFVSRADEVLTVDAVFDLEQAIEETLEGAGDLFTEALRVGWQTGQLRINNDATFDPEQPWVQRALERLNSQMRRVPENTRAIINRIITEGQADADKSVEDIARDIRERMERMASGTGGPDQPGSVTQSRARRVAATSTTTAFETAQDRAWRSQGVEASSWLSQRDQRVSEGHFEADGQRRDLGQPFDVRRTLDRPKEELMHPGDPEGRASNIVNCRCSRRPLLDRNTE